MPRENSFIHSVETGGGGSGLVRYFSGQRGRGILGSPTFAALGIDVCDSLGECARKRYLPVQGVESPNFKECRRVSIVVEALLQRGPGAPEPPDEAVERLVPRGPDMGKKPEQEERERAVALAKTVKTAAENGLSAGGEAKLREISDGHWNAFRRGLRGDLPVRVEPLMVRFKLEEKMVKARGCVTHRSKPPGWRHALEPWPRSG